jgi:hypothetical protein
VKAVPFIALAVALVGSLFAAGAYYRVRTAGPAEVDTLKARVAQLQKDLSQANDRMARLERFPQHVPASNPDPAAPAAQTGDLAELRKRIENLERRQGPARPGGSGDMGRVVPNPAMVESQKKRLTDASQTERSRAQALTMLRSQGANRADDVVDAGLALLAQSTEANIRGLIIRGLRGAENPRVLQPLIALLRSDPDEDVRDEAARTVGEYLPMQEARTALEQAAAEDASEKVKRQATAALNAPPKTK